MKMSSEDRVLVVLLQIGSKDLTVWGGRSKGAALRGQNPLFSKVFAIH